MEQIHSALPEGWDRQDAVETYQTPAVVFWLRSDTIWLLAVMMALAVLVVSHLLFTADPDQPVPLPQSKAAILQLCGTPAPTRTRQAGASQSPYWFLTPTPRP